MIPNGETVYIKNTLSLPLKNLYPLIRLAQQEQHPARLSWAWSISGRKLCDVVVTFFPDKMYFRFAVTHPNGGRTCSYISVEKRRSNLIKGAFVYYFHNGQYRGRVVYYDPQNGTFYLRGEQRPRYLSQYDRTHPQQDPTRKYGKMYYRGKLTPYGRRVLWYDKNETRREYYILAGKYGKDLLSLIQE